MIRALINKPNHESEFVIFKEFEDNCEKSR